MQTKHLLIGLGVSLVLVSRLHAADPAPPPAPQPGVTLVNMHVKNVVAQDAFDQLTKQSGVRFSTNGNLWEQDAMMVENDVDLTNRPFWSAVNEVCGLWSISLQQNYGMMNGRRVQLGQTFGQNATQLPTVEYQGFLIQAASFNRQQTVNYAMAEQSTNFCSLQLMVFVDPSLHVLSFSQNVKADTAVDDAGHSMIPDAKNNVFYGNNQQRGLVYTCNIPLKFPENAGKKIADLKFNLQMRASDTVDTMTVDKPLEAEEATKDFGDTTVVFHSLKKTAANGSYELKIGISKDDNDNGNNLWGLAQSGQLMDSKGHAFNNFGGGGGGGGNGMSEYTVNYSSNNNGGGDTKVSGDPTKWVFEMPTNPRVIKIPVEFKDLALP